MTLYRVDDGKRVRLIEAKTRAGARSFAAQSSIKVDRATAHDAHTLAVRGVKLEVAKEGVSEQTDIDDQPTGG